MSDIAVWDDVRKGYRVFIGDLANRVGKYDLEREFKSCGPITDVWVARNPPGFAFLVFKYANDAEKAVRKQNGRAVQGKRIRVEHARSFQERQRLGVQKQIRAHRGARYTSNRLDRNHFRVQEGKSYDRSYNRPRSRSRSRSKERRKYGSGHEDVKRRFNNRKRSHSRSVSRSRSRSRSPSKSRSRNENNSSLIKHGSSSDKKRSPSNGSPDRKKRKDSKQTHKKDSTYGKCVSASKWDDESSDSEDKDTADRKRLRSGSKDSNTEDKKQDNSRDRKHSKERDEEDQELENNRHRKQSKDRHEEDQDLDKRDVKSASRRHVRSKSPSQSDMRSHNNSKDRLPNQGSHDHFSDQSPCRACQDIHNNALLYCSSQDLKKLIQDSISAALKTNAHSTENSPDWHSSACHSHSQTNP